MSATTLKSKKLRISRPLGFCLVGLAPVMILYTYLRFIPIISTFYLSFHSWNMISSKKPFIGFENYIKLFSSDLFIDVLKNTTVIAFSILMISLPLSLFVANALVNRVRFKSFLESSYFLPVIMPMVPITIAWKGILGTDTGFLNYFLSFFGIENLPWMTNPTLATISVIIIAIWKNLGYDMLIFSVGLTGIPKGYYEAASIDGATCFKSFRYITIPLLKPVTLFISIMALIKGYNVFSTVYILASDTQGSPGYIVRVLVYDMFENSFRFFKMGFASAEAVVLFVIVFILTIVQFGLNHEKNYRKPTRQKRKVGA